MADYVNAIADGAIVTHQLVYATGDSGGSQKVAVTTASTDIPLGVAMHDADDTESVRIQVTGEAVCIAAGVITAGTHIRLKPAADGELAASPASGDAIAGVFVRSLKGSATAAANDRITVILTPGASYTVDT